MTEASTIDTQVCPDAEAAAQAAADFIATHAERAILARGRFLLAVSGGSSPRRMLELLAEKPLPWNQIHIFQVDERVAPMPSPERNLTMLREALLDRALIPLAQVHLMDVEGADLAQSAAHYAQRLSEVGGAPAVLDLVQLGLGEDGHTASLVPGDAILDVVDRDVAITEPYQGHRRMSLTYPALDRARAILWLVMGAAKREAVAQLMASDQTIPAGRVAREQATLLVDREASGGA